MEKERFAEILKEYDYTDEQIDVMWNMRPSDDMDEAVVRNGIANARLP